MKHRKTVILYLTDEEMALLKHCSRRLGLDPRSSKKSYNTGSLRRAVEYAAKMCARIENEHHVQKSKKIT